MDTITKTQSTVNLVKASAGSGKTYRLTKEFLARILDEDIPWREVLAVTFTNKATAEMKGRIVDALQKEGAAEGKRGAKARAILEDMLRHYGGLHVGTIDSYLQGAAGAVEEGGRRVDLDEDAIIRNTVERVMEDSRRDAVLAGRLRSLARRQVEDGKSWDVRGTVHDMTRRFLEEPFLVALLEEGSVVTDPAKVDALALRCAAETESFIKRLKDLGNAALDAMAAEGRAPEEYKGKSRSPMTAFYRWAEGVVKEPGAKFPDCVAETEGQGVQRYVQEALDLFDGPYREYRTAKVLAESVPYLGLWSAIWTALGEVLDERGTTMLRRSAARLAAVAQDDEAYIQERSGERIGAMLVDEAQDTSLLQWENLRRIARETLSRGGSVLGVGDVKQSIYRWRGADWRLLSGGMQDSMPEAAFKEDTLDTNWRSTSAVVEMNNTLYGGLAQNIAQVAPAETAQAVAKAYSDAIQAMPAVKDGNKPGYARVEALEGDDWADKALDKCVADIIRCRAQGYAWREIAVLVRKNSEGGMVAQRLLQENIPVVTEDGLQAGANACVQKAAAAVRLAQDPHDEIAAFLCGGQAADIAGTVYETVLDAIRKAGPQAGDAAYVQVLADQAMAYQQREGSDLRGFLDWWYETGCHKSVGGGEGRDAVRVMTIHKSKGLGLECVIVPLAGEKITPSPMLVPTIWCRPDGKFHDAGLVPVKAFEKTLRGTGFDEAFRTERTMQWLDVLNTLYVATTRACSRLYVYMPLDDATKAATRVSSIVQRTVEMPGGILEMGEETSHEAPVAEALTVPMTGICEGGTTKVTAVMTADEYFAGEGEEVEF